MRKGLAGSGVAVVAIVGLAVAAHFAGFSTTKLFGWKEAAAAVQAPQPIPVTTVPAKAGVVPRIIAGIGLVSALQSVTVGSRVEGEITSIDFQEGAFVKAGDVLAELDKRQLKAGLDGAMAKKAQDQALLDNAKSDSSRYAELAKKGVIATGSLDEKVSLVKQYEAAVVSDQSAISSAETGLSYATIRAPLSGRTGFRRIDQGAVINPSSTDGLVTITQLDPIGVVFVAPGDRFGEIRDALKAGIADVEALTTDGTRVLARGTLTLMDNAVDSQNGSVRLKATFDNKTDALWPGLPVATRLVVGLPHGVVVPDKALARGTDGLSAYVVGKDGRATRRTVETSVVTDGYALVTSGLNDGDQVVYDGLGQISDGASVTIGAPPALDSPAYAASIGTLPGASVTP